MKNKTLINIHAKNYISAVFEQQLRAEGFVCPDDKLLCWYRIRNQEVLDTVCFFSPWSKMPLMMSIYYEALPLFTKPLYIKSVHYNEAAYGRSECYECRPILDLHGNKCYSESISVYVPTHGNCGLSILSEVALPYFSKIQTVQDCYMTHKKRLLHKDSEDVWKYAFHLASREIIDEVIYVGDVSVYPDCKDRVSNAVELFNRLVVQWPSTHEYVGMLEHWEQLETAFFDNGIEAYIDILNLRKQKNTKYLTQKLGIEIR